jgi:predicted Zn-dependent protease
MTTAAQVDQLESFLAQDPANLNLLAESVNAAVRAGQSERARAILERGRAATSIDAPLRHLEATILLAEHRFTEARELLTSLIRDGADAPGVVFNLGYAALRAGDPAAGAAILAGLLARPDAAPETLTWLLRCHLHAGHPEHALAAWNAAPLPQRTPEAAGVASLACFDADLPEQARQLADGALVAGATSLEPVVVRAAVALSDGEFANADQLLARGRQIAPQDPRLRFTCGLAQLLRGRTAEAHEEFRFAVDGQPRHAGGWIAFAWSSIFIGNLAEARSSLAHAMALDRNFAETHGALAVVDALEGHREAAQAGIERASRLDRNSMAWHYAEAVLAGAHHDASRMRARVDDLMATRPDKARFALLGRLRRPE